ncbi:insulinase family protein [Pleionea sediminis]|uniref:insulinase family protein n=1 Tax=Pleionea sediminis TaxID=2569479 RepID=UPI001185CF18|nr:insulinase family protein [Pleionea sediminis]
MKIGFKPFTIGILLGLGLVSGCGNMATSYEVTQLTDAQINKSPNDERAYEYFVLDNGLRALVISDPSTDKSAAALDVHVGHMADPKDRLGLAHYLEHMLFLGTQKYPEVGEYSEFIKKHGGMNNAGTGQQHTTYFFDIKPDYLEPALDRFAQFFIAPLFDPQYVEREKNAVHSEYKLKIKEEGRRIREVLKATSNPEHPASQFSVGNLDTLAERDGDPILPDLKAFYAEHYSASRMTVTVLGKESIDELKAYVKSKFSDIKNNGSQPQNVKTQLFKDDQLGVRINITPLKDAHTLSLQFPMPSSTPYYKKKPLGYLSNLIRNEAKGSLYDQLKSKGWIESIAAYNYGPDDTEIFFIEYALTKEGMNHIDSITDETFVYIEKIRQEGIEQQRFLERKKIAELNFQFKEKSTPASEVSSLATTMQYVEPQHILNYGYLYKDFDNDLIAEYANYLTPSNLRQVVIAQGLSTDKVEPLYQTPYSMQKLDGELLSEWSKVDSLASYKLPGENKFIAENPTVKSVKQEQEIPELHTDKPGFKLYYKQDNEFKLPKADVFVSVYSQLAGDDSSNRAKMQLYTALLNDSLESYAYAAREAGLRYSLWSNSRGLTYAVYGYDQKQDMLMKVLNERIMNLAIDPERFNIHKDRLIRAWKNSKFNRPISQVFGGVNQTLLERSYAPEVLAGSLKNVTVSDMESYIKAFHKAGSVEVLAHGNVDRQYANQLSAFLQKELMKSKSIAEKPESRVYELTSGKNILELDIDHNDSAIVVLFQGDKPDLKLTAKYRLATQVMSQSYYKTMRTDQQLGYVVGVTSNELAKVPNISFFVQSPKVGPIELEKRIDTFVRQFVEELDQMSDVDFVAHKEGLINDIKKNETRMVMRSVRYNNELSEGYTDFNKRDQLVETIQKASKEDIKTLIVNDILQADRRFVSRNVGQAHRDNDYQSASKGKNLCGSPECMASKLTKFK